MKNAQIKTVFGTAMRHFPISNLRTTGKKESATGVYGQEYTFDFGKLKGIPVVAKGWVEAATDGTSRGMNVCGVFLLQQKWSWLNWRGTSEKLVLRARYDFDHKHWVLDTLELSSRKN